MPTWAKWLLGFLGVGVVVGGGALIVHHVRRGNTALPAGKTTDFEFLEVTSDGGAADRELPIVVALHGKSAQPNAVIAGIEPALKAVGMPPSRVIAPFGPLGAGTSERSWLSVDSTGDQAVFRRELEELGPKLAAWIEAIVASRKVPLRGGKPHVVVVGYSQGAHAALARAVNSSLGSTVAVNGWIPADLVPASLAPSSMSPTTWVAGDGDTKVPFARSQSTVQQLVGRGLPVMWKPVAGAGHAWDASLRPSVNEAVAAQLRPALQINLVRS